MRKIMWIISFISLIGTAIAIQFMPESVPMHHDLAGNIDRWGSRYENFIFPAVILAMSLHWTLFIRHYEKKARLAGDDKKRVEILSNVKVLTIVGLVMAAGFTVMQGFILYKTYNEAVFSGEKPFIDTDRIWGILMGVMVIVLGNFMTKTRNNATVGFRCKWTRYNDVTWQKGNRFAAYAHVVAGLVTVVTAALVKNLMTTAILMGAYILAALAVSLIYAYKIYTEEIKKNGTDNNIQK